MSEDKESKKNKNSTIGAFIAEEAEKWDAKNFDNNDYLKELEYKVSKLEFLLEESSKNKDYIQVLSEYTKELKSETRFYKWMRIFMIAFSLIFVIFLLSLLVCVVFYHQILFYFQGPYFRSSLLIAIIGGSVVITSLILRGVFRLATERHADEEFPPHIEKMINAANAMNRSQTS